LNRWLCWSSNAEVGQHHKIMKSKTPAHLQELQPQAAGAAIAVEELITAANTADATCSAVELALRWHTIISNATLCAEVCSKGCVTAEAAGTVAELLLVAACVAYDVLQLLPGQAVVKLLHSRKV
jgi:hypothetical protein